MDTTFILQYTMSFFTTLFVLTYLLKVPHYITNQYAIVNEYYNKHFVKNVPLDFIFVFLYLQVGYFVINMLNIKKILYKLLIIIITTILLTSGFCFYYRSYPMTSSFFSRWFHNAGYSSALYDGILLAFVYLGIEHLKKTI